jgi:hypothetical protein
MTHGKPRIGHAGQISQPGDSAGERTAVRRPRGRGAFHAPPEATGAQFYASWSVRTRHGRWPQPAIENEQQETAPTMSNRPHSVGERPWPRMARATSIPAATTRSPHGAALAHETRRDLAGSQQAVCRHGGVREPGVHAHEPFAASPGVTTPSPKGERRRCHDCLSRQAATSAGEAAPGGPTLTLSVLKHAAVPNAIARALLSATWEARRASGSSPRDSSAAAEPSHKSDHATHEIRPLSAAASTGDCLHAVAMVRLVRRGPVIPASVLRQV